MTSPNKYPACLFASFDQPTRANALERLSQIRLSEHDVTAIKISLNTEFQTLIEVLQREMAQLPSGAKSSVINVEDDPLVAIINLKFQEHSAELQRVRGLVISCSLLIMHKRQKPFTNTVKNACRAIRMLSTKYLPEFEDLPRQSRDSLTGWISYLQAREKDPLLRSAFLKHLASLRVLFQKYFLDKPQTTRNRATARSEAKIIAAQENTADLDISAEIITYRDMSARKRNVVGVHSEEALADQEEDSLYVRVVDDALPAELASIMAIERRNSMGNLGSLNVQKQRPPTSSLNLNEFEAKAVANYCIKTLDDVRMPFSEVGFKQFMRHLFCLLSLLTGRTADYLVKLPVKTTVEAKLECFWLRRRGRCFLAFAPQIPMKDISNEFERPGYLKDFTVSKTGHLLLPFPEKAEAALLKFLQTSSLKTRYLEVPFPLTPTRKMRRLVGRDISAAHLVACSSYFYKSQGVDELISAWLTGKNHGQITRMYYTQTRTYKLLDQYFSFIATHLGQPEECIPGLPPRDEYLGSAFVPRMGAISTRFKKIVADFWDTPMDSKDALKHRHNKFVGVTYLICVLGTAHRPQSDQFSALPNSNSKAKTIFISDKEFNKSGNGRLLPMADVVEKQIRIWKNYRSEFPYTSLSALLEPEELANLASEPGDHSLFHVSNGKALPWSPASIKDFFSYCFPWAANWPRHLLASWLLEKGAPGELIALFMGHGQTGQVPDRSDSGLPITATDNLKDAIDTFLEELDIKPITWTNGDKR